MPSSQFVLRRCFLIKNLQPRVPIASIVSASKNGFFVPLLHYYQSPSRPTTHCLVNMTNKIHIALALCVLMLPCVLGFDTSKYTSSKQMTSSYKLYWKVMEDTQQIALGFEVSTLGWFGFGIAELSSGSMPGSDVMVIQKDTTDGHIYIQDRYTYAFAEPKQDDCQENDWTLVSSEEKNGVTYVEVTRPLAARDNQDRTIIPGNNAIIMAWGTNDVKSIGYHGANRLATLHCFWDCPNDDLNVTDVPSAYAFSISMPNISLPNQETTYMCYALPVTTPNDDDVHIVRINFIPNSNIDNAVHHMVLHLCEDFTGGSKPSIPSLYSAGPTDCTDPNPSPLGYPGCTVLYAWARGGRAMNLPEEAGFRIRSTSNSSKYLVLDMHYNNPNLVPNVVDGSGIEMIATTELRTYDAATITLGDPAVLLPDIPAGQSAWHVELTCPSACTETFPHDIHIFADYFHMHEIGKTGYSVIHSNNSTSILNRVEYYAFANQHAVPVNLTLKPGDRINTNCVWDSTSRTKPTNMYIASTDEMCMEFMTYYPAIPDMPLCGYYNYHGANLTVCGKGVINVVNPSVVDVPSAVNRTFGTADSDLCDYVPMTPTSAPSKVPIRTPSAKVSSGHIVNIAASLIALIMVILL